jgi:hypothetical protein
MAIWLYCIEYGVYGGFLVRTDSSNDYLDIIYTNGKPRVLILSNNFHILKIRTEQ